MVGASLVDNDSDLGHNTTVVDVGRNSGMRPPNRCAVEVLVHHVRGLN